MSGARNLGGTSVPRSAVGANTRADSKYQNTGTYHSDYRYRSDYQSERLQSHDSEIVDFHLPSKDQETAAICFALLSFFSPVLIGGLFYAIIKAFS